MKKDKKDAKTLREEFEVELHEKYDCGWAQGLKQHAIEKGYMDKPAIFYRGTKVCYAYMFAKAQDYANSMRALGLGKGSIIPLFMSHCPETIYTLLAASFIGAQVTPIGEHFDEDYIVERLKKSGSDVVFMTDDKYIQVEEALSIAGIHKIVMCSLMDSYKMVDGINPYEKLEKGFFDGKNNTSLYKSSDSRIIDIDEFEKMGRNCQTANHPFEVEKVGLDEPFSITFSSGTTNSHRPKAIIHPNKTYLGMGLIRTKETPDLNKFSKNGEIKTLVHIPLYSNTSLLAGISDGLYLGSTLCLEHIYDEHFFPISILINKPNQIIATPSHWICGMKEWDTNPIYENADLKFLMSPFTAGEPVSPGEEKFINSVFRKFHAAYDFLPFKFINALGMGAGDCENCGLWRLPHKATMEKLKKGFHPTKRNVQKGYETYKVVDWAILDKDGHPCMPYELGRLVIDSPFTMIGYDTDDELQNWNTKILDADGRIWTDCKLWASYDEMGEVFIKGRYSLEEDFPTFLIDDEIMRDTKNIMSSKVVRLDDGTYVAHIDIQPGKIVDEKSIGYETAKTKILYGIECRLSKSIPSDILERLVYRVRPQKDSFPLTGSGKRDAQALISEGIAHTNKPIEIVGGGILAISGERHISTINNAKKIKLSDKE